MQIRIKDKGVLASETDKIAGSAGTVEKLSPQA